MASHSYTGPLAILKKTRMGVLLPIASGLWLAFSGNHTQQPPPDTSPLTMQPALTASDGSAGDTFGASVALSADGQTLAVGAPLKTVNGHWGQGAAYVFTRTNYGWTQTQALTAGDGDAADFFGQRLALSADGQILVVGAPLKTVRGHWGQGAAYVFIRNGDWTQTETLTARDGTARDHFGHSLALSADGRTLAVGAAYKTLGSEQQGAAYVFTRTHAGWDQMQALIASDSTARDQFGTGIALSADGRILAVGAVGKTINGKPDQGSVYVFSANKGVWTQMQTLTARDGAMQDQFGWSLALSANGQTLAIGAHWKTINGPISSATGQGAAYVFSRTSDRWTQIQALTAHDGAAFDYFGESVALSGDGLTLAVGASNKTVKSQPYQGVTYLFIGKNGEWRQRRVLTACKGTTHDFFGSSISLPADGQTLAIGAPYKTPGSHRYQGTAYVFAPPVITRQR